MHARSGDTVDPNTGRCLETGDYAAVGITGTGVVGLISQCLKARLIKIPRINTLDTEIHLPNGIKFTEKDLLEAGKAIGAVRAGHITLCHEAGIDLNDIKVAYCSGASGTYVDAIKSPGNRYDSFRCSKNLSGWQHISGHGPGCGKIG